MKSIPFVGGLASGSTQKQVQTPTALSTAPVQSITGNPAPASPRSLDAKNTAPALTTRPLDVNTERPLSTVDWPELSMNEIKLIRLIGKGQFGDVFEATYHSSPVRHTTLNPLRFGCFIFFLY
jgi:hypothetical protein